MIDVTTEDRIQKIGEDVSALHAYSLTHAKQLDDIQGKLDHMAGAGCALGFHYERRIKDLEETPRKLVMSAAAIGGLIAVTVPGVLWIVKHMVAP